MTKKSNVLTMSPAPVVAPVSTLRRLTAKKVVKKSSTMREVIPTNQKAVEAVIVGRNKIKALELEIKQIKGDIENFEQTVKGDIFSCMGSIWESVKLLGKKGNLKAIWQDRFSVVDGSVLETSPELERFLEFRYSITPEAIERPEIFKELEKFLATMEKKFGVDLLEQKLHVKKGSLKIMLAEKNQTAIEILNPVLAFSVENINE